MPDAEKQMWGKMEFQKLLSSLHWKNRNEQEQNKNAEKGIKRNGESKQKMKRKKDEKKDKENDPSHDKKMILG